MMMINTKRYLIKNDLKNQQFLTFFLSITINY